jgi:hypothetical protein
MQVSAILLARAVALIDTFDLNPRGRVPVSAIAEALVRRFEFATFPKSAAEFDESKGVKFASGFVDGTVIDELTVWNNGLVLDTRASTATTKHILESSLFSLSQELGLAYEPRMIKGWGYLSRLTFYSNANFDLIHPAVKKLCDRLTTSVSQIHGREFKFAFGAMSLNWDNSKVTSPVANFMIQRRVNEPFSENKFFCEAPVPTELLEPLLIELEADLNAIQTTSAR